MISLGILEHLEGGADQFLGIVQGGPFHKLQAVLVHEDPHSSLLKQSENRAEWMQGGINLIGLIHFAKKVRSM